MEGQAHQARVSVSAFYEFIAAQAVREGGFFVLATVAYITKSKHRVFVTAKGFSGILFAIYLHIKKRGNVNQQTEWITTEEAAEIMGVSIRNVQHLCHENKDKEEPDLICQQWGRSWMVNAESARNYIRTNRGKWKSS
jgi:hypothetical protein